MNSFISWVDKNANYLTIVGWALPFIALWSNIYTYAYNFPMNDDYAAILYFFREYFTLDSLQEKLKLLFAQHNEHRIAFGRLLQLGMYNAIGTVDVRLITLISNGLLLGIAFPIIKGANFPNGIPMLFLVSFPIIVLIPNSYEIWCGAMTSYSHIPAVTFAILAFYFATREHSIRSMSWCLVFSFLSAFSNGSGLFVLPVCIYILLLKKNWKSLAGFGLVTILILWLYFGGFVSPSHSKPLDSLSQPGKLFYFLSKLIGNFLVIRDLTFFAGVIVILFFAFIFIYMRYDKKNTFIFSCIAFFLLNLSATAFNRLSLYSEDLATRSAYQFYSIFLFGFLCLCFYELFIINNNYIKDKRIQLVAVFIVLSIAVKYSLDNYRGFQPVMERFSQIARTINVLYLDKNKILEKYESESRLGYDFAKYMKYNELDKICKIDDVGYYVTPPVFFSRHHFETIKERLKTDTTSCLVHAKIERINYNISDEVNQYVLVYGYVVDRINSPASQRITFALESDNGVQFFKANSMYRPDIGQGYNVTTGHNHDYAGFYCLIDKDMLKDNSYNMSIVYKNNNELTWKALEGCLVRR